ncbi:pentatricopeptide repeat-containing protein At5g09450, mitochondrial [Salvia hispanica]|uniref:pentatricopeptide repeat-containing protein At5g09450, mitochondrial n=1 Tax=Salvia hispanica TaxID=49212 RepID=UPI00200986E5|nr:pentatricopeptide repeat-containing protein At5g09450, mitochondrial [Salvia hispanica]
MAAARFLFHTLTRNGVRGSRTLSRSISSSIEAVKEESVAAAPEEAVVEYVEDDLKSRIFRLRLPKRSVTNVLEKWVAEGRAIPLSDLRSISRDLRRSRRFKHALEISEWIVSHEEYQISDSDYAVRIDLMTQVFGIDAAERYFEALPSSAKTSETYTALLHCYAGSKLVEKAEALYERMKRENLSLSAITFNELMTLYMSVGQLEKVSLIVRDMKCQNVAPDLFTYNLWVSSCAAALDLDEARRILDTMIADPGCDESWIRYQKLAKLYITSTQLVSSDSSSLVESEKGITQRELISYDFLIILYGGLGSKDKLDQIWKSLRMTGQKMTGRNYVCVLASYLMLGYLEDVGEIVEQWKQPATSEFNSTMCNKLAAAFEEIGMADTAAGFRRILREKGCDPVEEPR